MRTRGTNIVLPLIKKNYSQTIYGRCVMTPESCLIFLKFKNNTFCMVKHQYWSANT